MRFLKAFGTFYIVVAGLVGIFYYLSYRIDCIKSDGFFNAFTGDCKISGFNMVTRLPPGLIESQLKGLMWGYDLILAIANGQEISDAERKAVLVQIKKAIESGDQGVIRKIDQLALKVVSDEKKSVGKLIDEHTRMTNSSLKGKTISLELNVESDAMFSIIKSTPVFFKSSQTKSLCADPDSKERQVLDLLFAANYKFEFKYKQNGKSDEISVLIDKCD